MVGNDDGNWLSVGVFDGVIDEIVKSHPQQMGIGRNRKVALAVHLAATLGDALQQWGDAHGLEFCHLLATSDMRELQ